MRRRAWTVTTIRLGLLAVAVAAVLPLVGDRFAASGFGSVAESTGVSRTLAGADGEDILAFLFGQGASRSIFAPNDGDTETSASELEEYPGAVTARRRHVRQRSHRIRRRSATRTRRTGQTPARVRVSAAHPALQPYVIAAPQADCTQDRPPAPTAPISEIVQLNERIAREYPLPPARPSREALGVGRTTVPAPVAAEAAPSTGRCGLPPMDHARLERLAQCSWAAAGKAYVPSSERAHVLGRRPYANRGISKGRCYPGVKNAWVCAGLGSYGDFSDSPSHGVRPSEAHTSGLLRRLGMKNILPQLASCYGAGAGKASLHVPRGAIMVYGGGAYGHIEIKVDDRNYCSDFCNYRPIDLNSKRGHRRTLIGVYVP